MAKQLTSVDISNRPTLLEIVEQVQVTGEPLVLRWNDEDVAILRPVRRARRPRVPRGRPFTKDDPLWNLKGNADEAPSIEDDPEFPLFLNFLVTDALRHPEKLVDPDELLAGVDELIEGVDPD